MVMTVDGTNGITFPDASAQPKASVQPPQSMIRVNTTNGYGITNTFIRRFLNIVLSQGSDITYADSAANGGSFTINTSGVYAISYSDNIGVALFAGISLNSNQLSTNIQSINAVNIVAIALGSNTTNTGTHCGATIYLQASDVLRAHLSTNGAVGSFPSNAQFIVTRVA